MLEYFRRVVLVLIVTFSLSITQQSGAQERLHWKLVVLSKMKHQPIANATVLFNDVNTLFTKQNGELNRQLPIGKDVHIHVSCVGFTPEEKHIYINQNDQTDTVYLEPIIFELNEVNISEKLYKKNPLSTSQILRKKDLEKVVGENLAQQLSQLQGVSVLQTGATIAKPVINGMHSNRILILNNGVRQEGQQWGTEHAPEIDPFIAKSITVIKGAESVRYGADAIGGVVLVTPPALPVADIIHGEVAAVGESNGRKQSYSATIQGNFSKISKWGWRAQGSYTKSGDLKAPGYFLTNTGAESLNFSTAIGYNGNKIKGNVYASHFQTELGILKAANIGNQEDLLARIKAGKPFVTYPFSTTIAAPKQDVSHDLIKFESEITLKNQTELKFQYSFQHNHRQEYDIRRGSRTATPSLDLHLYSQSLDASWRKDYKETWRTEAGIQAATQVNNSTPGTFVTPLIPNYDSYSAGVFAIQKYIRKNALYEAGIRYDYKHLDALGYNKQSELYGGTFNFHNISWNLAAELHISPSLHFNSNLGMAWRPPQVNELFSIGLHHGTATLELGDPNLKSENALKWVNTLSLHGEKVEFELSLFAQYIKNYIYLNPTLELDTSIRGVYPVFQYEQNNALFAGGDLWFKYNFIRNLSYEVKATIVQAKNLTQDNFLPLIPPYKFIQTLGYSLNDLRKFKQNYIQIIYQYTTKQNRYNPNSDFAAPPPAYGLWNAQIGSRLPIANQNLSVNLTINNIFNKVYKDYMNRFRYYADDLGRNIQFRLIYKF